MAILALRKNSTIVRNAGLLALRARFVAGSWLRPGATLRQAYDLFCTPLSGTRRRAAEADTAGARVSEFMHGNERLALYTWGDPSTQPYVLLSHGWSSLALRFQPCRQLSKRPRPHWLTKLLLA